MKERLISELEKRLDLDIDDILEAPKLRLQLSPGELDKQLLELYKNIANGPSGDVLRVIGGGQEVAFQDLYIKRRAKKDRKKQLLNQAGLSFGPFDPLDDDASKDSLTASQWVQQTLNKNLRSNFAPTNIPNSDKKSSASRKEKSDMKMVTQLETSRTCSHAFSPLASAPTKFCPPRKSASTFSLLI